MLPIPYRSQSAVVTGGDLMLGRLVVVMSLLVVSQQLTTAQVQAETGDLTRVQVTDVSDSTSLTVQLSDGSSDQVTLIGLDTDEPESPRTGGSCSRPRPARRASELAAGRVATLEADVAARDRAGHLEAYVWLSGDDGRQWMLNERLVAEGLSAPVSTPPNLKYSDRFSAAAQTARDQGLGLWSPCLAAATATPILAVPRSSSEQTELEIARTTPTPVPTLEKTARFNPDRYINRGDRYDCTDFKSQADAQSVLRAAPGDPNLLDVDHDGIACELIAGPYDYERVQR
jgi:micrococcal nuclease